MGHGLADISKCQGPASEAFRIGAPPEEKVDVGGRGRMESRAMDDGGATGRAGVRAARAWHIRYLHEHVA